MARVYRQQDITVIELDAAYDALDSGPFDRASSLLLGSALSVNPPLAVLDLSHTAYIGSAFIEVMFRAWKRLRDRGGRLALCGLQPFCAEVLRVARLDSVFESYEALNDAVASLNTH